MHIIDHTGEPLDEWRPGVMTRMLVSALTGSEHLCVFEQFCDPGRGAPTHRHAVEEVLTVLEGTAELWLDDERATLTAGQSLVIPAERQHGFRNIGTATLHMRAILASPIFEAWFDGEAEARRRWQPRSSLPTGGGAASR
ncbi:cupin domain-containing protein [Falsiroseomonas oryzae]|uniref:cupin domain-containing protein n=1 Tax=Falsiroseomonas oryzae TaxID=2766473 RepID=UPI0022EAA6A1|nr:cupin domain-containing protein [Roseomonas sp. MO-31]